MPRKAQATPGEFATIARVFAPLAGPGGLGLQDDAALLRARAGYELVLTADAIVAGVHFLPDDPPDLVARKLIRVNVSDLTAKGARPLAYLLTTSWPRGLDAAWIARFGRGLRRDQTRYGLALLGGDTTATPGPMTLSCFMIGEVRRGGMVQRAGARAGDLICVTGTLGEGALGLLVRQGGLGGLAPAQARRLERRYLLPEPPAAFAPHLSRVASAAIDISDGLAADLGHLCHASGVGAEVNADALPLSAAVRRAVALDGARLMRVLAGGDDYQTLFTLAPRRLAAAREAARAAGVRLAVIGRVTREAGVRILDAAGREIPVGAGGYSHF